MREVSSLQIPETLKRIIKEYYEQVYANKFMDNMEQYLTRPKLPQLTQEEIDNLNSPISNLLMKLNLQLKIFPQRQLLG